MVIKITEIIYKQMKDFGSVIGLTFLFITLNLNVEILFQLSRV